MKEKLLLILVMFLVMLLTGCSEPNKDIYFKVQNNVVVSPEPFVYINATVYESNGYVKDVVTITTNNYQSGHFQLEEGEIFIVQGTQTVMGGQITTTVYYEGAGTELKLTGSGNFFHKITYE